MNALNTTFKKVQSLEKGRIAAPLLLWVAGVPFGIVLLLWFFFFRG